MASANPKRGNRPPSTGRHVKSIFFDMVEIATGDNDDFAYIELSNRPYEIEAIEVVSSINQAFTLNITKQPANQVSGALIASRLVTLFNAAVTGSNIILSPKKGMLNATTLDMRYTIVFPNDQLNINLAIGGGLANSEIQINLIIRYL